MTKSVGKQLAEYKRNRPSFKSAAEAREKGLWAIHELFGAAAIVTDRKVLKDFITLAQAFERVVQSESDYQVAAHFERWIHHDGLKPSDKNAPATPAKPCRDYVKIVGRGRP